MTRDPITHALDALQRGLLVGVPTDTVYGVAADPFDKRAMDRLFAVKGRESDNPIPILGASAQALRRVAILEGSAATAAGKHWPGGLTLVVPVAEGVPDWIGDERRTVAIRVPAHSVALELLEAAGPLAVTSANRSGEPAAKTADEARLTLGYGIAVCLEGDAGFGEASTVVDFTGDEPVVLREGPVRLDG